MLARIQDGSQGARVCPYPRAWGRDVRGDWELDESSIKQSSEAKGLTWVVGSSQFLIWVVRVLQFPHLGRWDFVIFPLFFIRFVDSPRFLIWVAANFSNFNSFWVGIEVFSPKFASLNASYKVKLDQVGVIGIRTMVQVVAWLQCYSLGDFNGFRVLNLL
ncbi:hypothetical protein ACFX2I_046262 [Malus domestica]